MVYSISHYFSNSYILFSHLFIQFWKNGQKMLFNKMYQNMHIFNINLYIQTIVCVLYKGVLSKELSS